MKLHHGRGSSAAISLLLVALGCSGPTPAANRDGLLFIDGQSTTTQQDAEQTPYPAAARAAATHLNAVPTATRDDRIAVVRSTLEFALAPVNAGEPLIWILDGNGRIAARLGEVEVPDNAVLGQLHNSGWAALGAAGAVYFAAALRPELRKFAADGLLAWVSTWTPDSVPLAPRLTARDGSLEPVFTTVQHGVVVGPKNRVYVLAASKGRADPDALLVFDARGQQIAREAVNAGDAIFVDRNGHIRTVPRDVVRSERQTRTRAAFRTFDLPLLSDERSLRLEDLRGNIVVLNFWASWCGPCRQEMPQLDRLARDFADQPVRVVGMNEDTDPADARAFLHEVPVTFPSVAGRGRLRARYQYRGLPYTVILDSQLRLIKAIHGSAVILL